MGVHHASMRVYASEYVDRSIDDVWGFLCDLTHLARFQAHIDEIRLVSGAHGTPGAVYEQKVKAGIAGVTTRLTVTAAEPGRSLAWRQDPARTRVRARVVPPEMTYCLIPEGPGTRLELRAGFADGPDAAGRRARSWLSPGVVLQKLALKAAGGGANGRAAGYLAALKDELESDSHVRRRSA